MAIDRRGFITGSFAAAGALALASTFSFKTADGRTIEQVMNKFANLTPSQIATDEDFWYYIQQCYTVSANIINLNNGGVSPQPKVVQDAFERFNRFCNENPSLYMWKFLDKGREAIRTDLADFAGCSAEEIAINRNTTEALETVIFGLNLQEGDEVVLTKQDYPSMIDAWKQREKRNKIKLVYLNLELPFENEDQVVKAYEDAFTSKTKVVQITHVINWTGQIMPAKKIAQAAHKRGIDVLVDGAHSFAHLDYKISDLECDYFGTSLHKWLCAPFGTGMLYVKKDKIKDVWPLYAFSTAEVSDIKKFEHLGTRSFPAEHAIGQAINFQNMIGAKRKQERLWYLKNYWIEKVKDVPNVKIHTSLKPEYACGIGLFSIEGKSYKDIADILLDKYCVHVTAFEWENIKGVRVTPHVYTMTKDLDILVKGIKEMAKS